MLRQQSSHAPIGYPSIPHCLEVTDVYTWLAALGKKSKVRKYLLIQRASDARQFPAHQVAANARLLIVGRSKLPLNNQKRMSLL